VDLQILKDTKPFKQLFAILLITTAVGIIITLFGILVSAIFVEGSILNRIEMMESMQHTGDLSLMKYLQFVSQLGFFIFPAIIFGFFIKANILEFFKMNKFPKLSILISSVLIMVAAMPLSDWLIYQNNLMQLPESLSGLEQWMRTTEEKAAYMTNLFLQMDSFSDYLVNIGMIGLAAALGEELLMRGVLQTIFIKATKNIHAGIWITAFVFSFIHLQFYGFFARMFMGAILGYLFYYTQNLWVPIIVHFFNNAAAVSYVYFTNIPLDSTNLSEMELEKHGTLYAFMSLLIVVAGLFFLRNYWIKNNKDETIIAA